MSKQPAPTEDERETYLQDLRRVGPSKPVGYLPLYTIRDFAHLTPKSMAAEAVAKGLSAAEFGPRACCIKSGALYLYDQEALARILQAHTELLKANRFPLTPDRFVKHIAKTWFRHDHPVYDVIAQAFGANPVRRFSDE